MIDNPPAGVATETFSSARRKFACGHGPGYTLHTVNHRQLDASDFDVQNIASQAPTARDAPIKVASTEKVLTARNTQQRKRQVNMQEEQRATNSAA